MWKVVFAKRAQKDAPLLKAAGLSQKAKELVRVVSEDPFKTPPRYERLVGNLEGLCSRRISIQHRFVYQVLPGEGSEDGYEGTVKVLRMWSHYDGVR